MTVTRLLRKWSWELASLTVIVLGVAATLVIRALPPGPLRLEAGDRIEISDGRVSFTAPAGWRHETCPAGPDCVFVSPAGAGARDTIAASIDTVGEGEPFSGLLSSGGQQITIDGVPAVRADDTRTTVIVAAPLPGGDHFILFCSYETREAEIRAGCDMVVDTLDLAS